MFDEKKKVENEGKQLLIQQKDEIYRNLKESNQDKQTLSSDSNGAEKENMMHSTIDLEKSEANQVLHERNYNKLWAFNRLCEMNFDPKESKRVIEELGAFNANATKKEELLLKSIDCLLTREKKLKSTFWETFQGKRKREENKKYNRKKGKKGSNFLSTHIFRSFASNENSQVYRSLSAIEHSHQKTSCFKSVADSKNNESPDKLNDSQGPFMSSKEVNYLTIIHVEEEDPQTLNSKVKIEESSSDNSEKDKNVADIDLVNIAEEISEADSDEEITSDEISDSIQNKLLVCAICFSTKRAERFINLSACDHLFCKRCLQGYLNELINTSRLKVISCPKEGCPMQIMDEELQTILKENIYLKYKKFKDIMVLNSNPDLRWCVRTGCDKYVVLLPRTGTKNFYNIICDCGQEMCSNCLSEWHEGLTCNQAVDKGYKIYTESVTVRKCPSCKRRIEKNGGCNLMQCPFCEFEFCWLCGKSVKENHYKWWNFTGCPGLQESVIEPSSFSGRVKRFFNNILRFLLLALFCILISPLVLVGLLVILLFAPSLIYSSSENEDEGCSIGRIACYFILIAIGVVFLPCNILLSPLLLRRIWLDFFEPD